MDNIDSGNRDCLGRWKALVISLEDAVDRRDQIVPQLEWAGISHVTINAVDGRKGVSADIEAQCDRDLMRRKLGRELADTEIACVFSHRKALEYILVHDLPGALVLEDDTVWSDEATSLLKSIKPGEFDFLQLDYGWAEFWRFSANGKIGDTDLIVKRLAKNAGLANSYLVSNRAAKHILSASHPVFLPADWPCDLRPLRPYAVVPRVCAQALAGGTPSYISKSRTEAKIKQKKRGRSGLFMRMLAPANKNITRNPPPPIPLFLYRFLTYRIQPNRELN